MKDYMTCLYLLLGIDHKYSFEEHQAIFWGMIFFLPFTPIITCAMFFCLISKIGFRYSRKYFFNFSPYGYPCTIVFC